MKIKTVLFAGVVITAMMLSSCGLFLGTSIGDRIDQFESDLNTDSRSSIMDNFSENDCEDYNLISDPSYWNDFSIFGLANRSFSISVSEGSSSASGTITYGVGTEEAIFFDLVDEGSFFSGEDWKITKIWLDTKDSSGEQIKILVE